MYLSVQVICILVCFTGLVQVDGKPLIKRSTNTEQSDLADIDQESKLRADEGTYAYEKAWKKSESIPDRLNKYMNDLNAAEIRIIMAYTYDSLKFYQSLNTDLRNNYGNSRNYPKATALLKRALGKLKNVNGQRLQSELYRGDSNNRCEDFKQKLNQIGTFLQFTSTSSDQNEAENFAGEDGMVLTIRHPRNYVNIEEFSDYETEREYLIPPGEDYKVVSVDCQLRPREVELSMDTGSRGSGGSGGSVRSKAPLTTGSNNILNVWIVMLLCRLFQLRLY